MPRRSEPGPRGRAAPSRPVRPISSTATPSCRRCSGIPRPWARCRRGTLACMGRTLGGSSASFTRGRTSTSTNDRVRGCSPRSAPLPGIFPPPLRRLRATARRPADARGARRRNTGLRPRAPPTRPPREARPVSGTCPPLTTVPYGASTPCGPTRAGKLCSIRMVPASWFLRAPSCAVRRQHNDSAQATRGYSRSFACCRSTRGYPDSDVETSPIYPHHHLRTLSAVPTSLDSSWDSETKRDSAELDFPEATVTHLADHHKPTRSSFSADDIVTRASALITEEEALFHPEQKGVTLDDLLLNNIDVRALVSELPRVVCKHSGAYWTPGQGTRSLLRFWAFNTPSTSKMNAAVPTDTLPAPLDQETPPVSRASDESEKPDPSPPDFKRHKSKSMQGLPLAQKVRTPDPASALGAELR
eukprot:scaffold772_cov236-Pinguiococcus_pyrenoidosus.AAC.6